MVDCEERYEEKRWRENALARLIKRGRLHWSSASESFSLSALDARVSLSAHSLLFSEYIVRTRADYPTPPIRCSITVRLSLFFLSVTFSCIPARRFRHELIRSSSSSSVCCCREMYTIAWPAERALSHPAHKVYLVACPPPVQHLGVVTLASSRPGDSRSTRPVVWCAACTVCVCACLSKWRRRAGYF